MAIEKLTTQQKSVGDAVEDTCTQSLAQQAEQIAQEQMQKAKELLDQGQQMLAQLPEKAITKLDEAIKFLMSIINGYIDVDSPEFDPMAIIKKIEEMLNPLIDTLCALPVPTVPGLKEITDLLDALKAMITSMSEGNGEAEMPSVEIPSVEIPPTLMATLKRLVNSLMSLCTTLPFVFINLIFQMFAAVIKMFKRIAEELGFPEIPYPLSLVPECIEMIPDMMNFVKDCPTKIYDTAYGTLKKMYGKITSLQVPSLPDDIKRPESLPACPLHSEQAEEDIEEDTKEDTKESSDEFTEEQKEYARALLKDWYG